MKTNRTAACLVVLGALATGEFICAQSITSAQLPKRLVADYGYWSRTQTPPYSSAQVPFRKLTHINHAGVSFGAKGNLKVRDGFLEPALISKAPWGGTGYGFSDVTPLVDYFNIMTYDCAGPWTDDGQLNSPIFPDPTNPEPYECKPGGSVAEAIDIYTQQLSISAKKLK